MEVADNNSVSEPLAEFMTEEDKNDEEEELKESAVPASVSNPKKQNKLRSFFE